MQEPIPSSARQPEPHRPVAAVAIAGEGAPGRFERVDWLAGSAAALVALSVYWATLAPQVTLGDSGIFSTAAFHAGVPSHPGYPVWTLYSWLFANLIPISNVACRVAFGSALAAAAACGLVAMMTSCGARWLFGETPVMARLKPKDREHMFLVTGFVAGLGFGLSAPVWEQAVVVSAWSMTNLLCALTLTLLMRWALAPAERRYLAGAVFVFGLLLTNAQHLILLAPPLALCVMLREPRLGRDFAWAFLGVVGIAMLPAQMSLFVHYPDEPNPVVLAGFLVGLAISLALSLGTRRFGSHWRMCLLCVGCFLAGFALCFYPALASMSNPPVNWGYPRNPEGFWHVFQRGQYERVNPSHDLPTWLHQGWTCFLTSGRRLGWHYLLPAFLPILALPWLTRRARLWLLGLVLVWVGLGPMLIALLNSPADRAMQELLALYYGASFIPLSVLSGWGLTLLAALLSRRDGSALAAAG